MLAYPDAAASYTVRVPRYRLLPMGFLHCLRHRKPACLVLIGAIYFNNLPIRDLHPLEFLTTFVVEVYARHTQGFERKAGRCTKLTFVLSIGFSNKFNILLSNPALRQAPNR